MFLCYKIFLKKQINLKYYFGGEHSKIDKPLGKPSEKKMRMPKIAKIRNKIR